MYTEREFKFQMAWLKMLDNMVLTNEEPGENKLLKMKSATKEIPLSYS